VIRVMAMVAVAAVMEVEVLKAAEVIRAMVMVAVGQ